MEICSSLGLKMIIEIKKGTETLEVKKKLSGKQFQIVFPSRYFPSPSIQKNFLQTLMKFHGYLSLNLFMAPSHSFDFVLKAKNHLWLTARKKVANYSLAFTTPPPLLRQCSVLFQDPWSDIQTICNNVVCELFANPNYEFFFLLLFQTAQYLKNLFSSYDLYDKALVCCYFPSVIYQVTP